MPMRPCSPRAASTFADGLDEQLLQLRNARFAGARLLREIEELIAMIEREHEHFVARRARRRDAMQPRQRRILVGTRNARGVREEIIELDARRHRRRAAVARTTSAPHALA